MVVEVGWTNAGREYLSFFHARARFGGSGRVKQSFRVGFEDTSSIEYFILQIAGMHRPISQALEAAAFISRSWQILKSSFSG